MKQIFLSPILILGFSCISAMSQSTTPIFRSISVGTPGQIRSISLGEDLKKVSDLLAKDGDGFVMTRGFGGARKIRIFTTASGKVREMIFEYGPEVKFEDKVTSYTEDLGDPVTKESFSSRLLRARVVAWDDGKTRFEVLEKSENGKTLACSVMIDKVVGK